MKSFGICKSAVASSLCVLVVAAVSQSEAAAQSEFPTEPVRIVLPFPPGGGTDFIGRLVADRLGEKLPQPVIVDNRPGAATIIGTEYVRRAPADGHTLLLATNSFVSNSVMTPEAQYDPLEDFEPVVLLGFAPNLLVVEASAPYDSIPDLLEAAKADPGGVSFVSYGPASAQLYAARILEQAADVELQDIPYQGHSNAMVGILGGEVDILFPSITAVLPQVQAGALKPLALGAEERSPMLPEVPTFQELGYDLGAGTWYALLAPAGTPEATVAQLTSAVTEVLEEEAVRTALAEQAVEIRAWGPAEFTAMMEEEIGRWETLKAAEGE